MSLGPSDFTSAAELPQTRERFSTGSKKIDDVLGGGGIESGAVTQFYGEPGGGKSLLCYTICVMLPSDYKAIYIDAEGKFRRESIELIAQGRGLNPSAVLQKIQVAQPENSHQQEKCIENACSKIKSDAKIKLLIVDSIINLYKADHPERFKLPKRQQQLNRYMHMLSNIAQSNNLAVIITNHIQSNPHHSSCSRTKRAVPAGGNVIFYVTTYTVHLMPMFSAKLYAELGRPDKYMAILEHGPSCYSKGYFTIDSRGIADYDDIEDSEAAQEWP